MGRIMGSIHENMLDIPMNILGILDDDTYIGPVPIEDDFRRLVGREKWTPITKRHYVLLSHLAPELFIDMVANGLINHKVGDGWIVTYLTDLQRTEDHNFNQPEDFSEYLDDILTDVPR